MDRVCCIKGCKRVHKAKGMCHFHYDYFKEHGTIDVSPNRPKYKFASRLSVDDPEKLFRYIDITDGCWIWIGAKFSGYGVLCKSKTTNGKKKTIAYKVHRIMYEKYVGELLEGMVIDHLCENRSCVNPFHLEQVTSAENSRRSFENQRFRNNNGIDKPLAIE